MEKSAKKYMEMVIDSIVRRYRLSYAEARSIVRESFLYNSLIKHTEETLHDDVNINADLVYEDYREGRIPKMKKSNRFKNNREINTFNSERIRNFRNINSCNAVEIPVDKIKLLYQIHIDGLKRYDAHSDSAYYRINNERVNGTIIVQPDHDEPGTYNLITGWKHYVIADTLEQDTIKAIVVDCSRKDFRKMIGCIVPYSYVATNELRVPEVYANSTVDEKKLITIREYAERHHQPMKPIVVDADNNIVDGYAQYVFNKEANVKTSQVLRIRRNLETFIGK